jgi:ATP-dependent DNA helicase PIF1
LLININLIMELNQEQQEVYDAILRGKNILITAPAGAGKSTIIKKFYSDFNKNCNILITSTTGISSILIGGTTLHSALSIGLGHGSIEQTFERIKKNKIAFKTWKDLKVLIIDEVSMLHPDLFDKLEDLARLIRDNDLPFGGIQLVLSGDFLQLPVINSDTFCFESKAWSDCDIQTCLLTTIVRQKDPRFQDCLNAIRFGIVNEEVISLLRSRIGIEKDDLILPTRLFSTNRNVEALNTFELYNLSRKTGNPVYQYNMSFSHLKNGIETKLDTLDKIPCLAEELLELSLHAQVMLLVNLDLEGGLVNGSRGVVVGFDNDTPVIKFMNGRVLSISRYRWEFPNNKLMKSLYRERVNHDEKIIIEQIPLKLAYAVTTHKCQGSTLDCAEIDLTNIFEHGQVYTALSRIKDVSGLYILKKKSIQDTLNAIIKNISAHPKALEFYSK